MCVPFMPTVLAPTGNVHLTTRFRAGQTSLSTAAGISGRDPISWQAAGGELEEGRGVELCADSGVRSPKSDPAVTRQALNLSPPTTQKFSKC